MSEFVFNVFKEKIRGIFLFREDIELKAWKQNSPNNHFCVTFLVELLVVNWSKEKVTLSIGILKINAELSQHESGLCCGSRRCWWCAGGSNWLRLHRPLLGAGVFTLCSCCRQEGVGSGRAEQPAAVRSVSVCSAEELAQAGINVVSEFSFRSARACSCLFLGSRAGGGVRFKEWLCSSEDQGDHRG